MQGMNERIVFRAPEPLVRDVEQLVPIDGDSVSAVLRKLVRDRVRELRGAGLIPPELPKMTTEKVVLDGKAAGDAQRGSEA